MRRAEEILTEAYDLDGWTKIAASLRAGDPTLGDKLVMRAIEQAQREAIEEAAAVALAKARDEGIATGIMTKIRELLPHREGQ